MRNPGRLSAAIEVLDEVLGRHRPAALALADWGKAHRFAGSGDRAAIGNLVYDALRQRASIAWAMGTDAGAVTGRLLALGAAAAAWGLDADAVTATAAETHGPGELTDAERTGLTRLRDPAMPTAARANVPEWLWPAWASAFGDDAVAAGEALTERAPLDVRANTLKADRGKVLAALAPFAAEASPLSPVGVRIAPPQGHARTPNIQAEYGFLKGWFELQDEGSQLASLMAAEVIKAAGKGQTLDLCAGGGGKSLALAAALGNKGQIFAFDSDRHRLAPIHDRLKRAGTRNVQVLLARPEVLAPMAGTLATVVIDAPCSGTGAWRRRPETKWRLSPEALATRVAEQVALLDQAAGLLRPGGAIVYITCSLLPVENEDQVTAFLARHPGWRVDDMAALWALTMGGDDATISPAMFNRPDIPHPNPSPEGEGLEPASSKPLPFRGGGGVGDVRRDRSVGLRPAVPGYKGTALAPTITPHGVLLTPHRTGTDGFFFTVLKN